MSAHFTKVSKNYWKCSCGKLVRANLRSVHQCLDHKSRKRKYDTYTPARVEHLANTGGPDDG